MHNVAITGLGIISSLGLNVDDHSRRLLDGDLGIKLSKLKLGDGAPQCSAPASRASEVVTGSTSGSSTARTASPGSPWPRRPRPSTTPASGELDPLRTAIVHGTSMGGTRALLEAQHLLETSGPESVPRKTMIKIWPNMAAAQIAMKYDLHGQQITVCTACASSIDAIGTAARLIADGRADAAITGGTEGGSVDDGEAVEFVPATYYSGNSYGMSSQEPDPRRRVAAVRRRSAGHRQRRGIGDGVPRARGPRPRPRRPHLRDRARLRHRRRCLPPVIARAVRTLGAAGDGAGARGGRARTRRDRRRRRPRHRDAEG